MSFHIDFTEFPPKDDEAEYNDGFFNGLMVQSPMGMDYPLSGYYDQDMSMWTMHTNFDIVRPMIPIIEKVDGVESITPISRYRLRIGIGKLFIDHDEVKRNIVKNLNPIVLQVHGADDSKID